MKQAPQDIPILDLKPEIEELWDEINGAIQRVLRSTEFILGFQEDGFKSPISKIQSRCYTGKTTTDDQGFLHHGHLQPVEGAV